MTRDNQIITEEGVGIQGMKEEGEIIRKMKLISISQEWLGEIARSYQEAEIWIKARKKRKLKAEEQYLRESNIHKLKEFSKRKRMNLKLL